MKKKRADIPGVLMRSAQGAQFLANRLLRIAARAGARVIFRTAGEKSPATTREALSGTYQVAKKSRTSSRKRPFHSAQRPKFGKVPTW